MTQQGNRSIFKKSRDIIFIIILYFIYYIKWDNQLYAMLMEEKNEGMVTVRHARTWFKDLSSVVALGCKMTCTD